MPQDFCKSGVVAGTHPAHLRLSNSRKGGTTMKATRVIALTVLLASTVGSGALAQTAKDLAGAWTLVSAEGYGSNPKGVLIFDGNGHFSSQLIRSDLPKYASNSRTQGTLEEYKATVQGYIGYFGTYSLNGTDLVLDRKSTRL